MVFVFQNRSCCRPWKVLTTNTYVNFSFLNLFFLSFFFETNVVLDLFFFRIFSSSKLNLSQSKFTVIHSMKDDVFNHNIEKEITELLDNFNDFSIQKKYIQTIICVKTVSSFILSMKNWKSKLILSPILNKSIMLLHHKFISDKKKLSFITVYLIVAVDCMVECVHTKHKSIKSIFLFSLTIRNLMTTNTFFILIRLTRYYFINDSYRRCDRSSDSAYQRYQLRQRRINDGTKSSKFMNVWFSTYDYHHMWLICDEFYLPPDGSGFGLALQLSETFF